MSMKLCRRLAALEATKKVRSEKHVRDMTDEELERAIYGRNEPGFDVSLFPGKTLRERAEAAARVSRGELEVSDEARYAARRWFAIEEAVQCGIRKDNIDQFVAKWLTDRYGPDGLV